jgi:anti-anti-sigma regulatory factor
MEFTDSQELGRVPVTILHVKGAIDREEPLVNKVKELFDAGTRNLLLDMEETTYINSLGMRGIATVYNMLRSADPSEDEATVHSGLRSGKYKSGHFKLLRPTKDVHNILHITGYDMFIEIFDNKQAAVDSF